MTGAQRLSEGSRILQDITRFLAKTGYTNMKIYVHKDGSVSLRAWETPKPLIIEAPLHPHRK